MKNDGSEVGLFHGVDKQGTAWVTAVGTLHFGRTTSGIALVCLSILTPWDEKFQGSYEQLPPEYLEKLLRFAFNNEQLPHVKRAAAILREEANAIWENSCTGGSTGPDPEEPRWADDTENEQKRFHAYMEIAQQLDPQ